METLSPFAFVTLVTLISGAGGTGLGGLIGALFKSESNRTISLLLAFAGGVMTAMVCFDLLAEAEEAAGQIAEHGVLLVILAVALGVAVVYLLNHLIDRKTRKEVSHTADAHHPETHDDIDELVHADHLNMHKRHNDSKLSLFVAGIVMACAIALHNIPEGMTIGASFAVSDNLMWGTGMIMAPGMIFTIEPMVNMGTNRIYIDADNDWTIYTQDGKPSAQWEIQVLVTETGHEVLAW